MTSQACFTRLSVNIDFLLRVGPETMQVSGYASLLSMTRMMDISNVYIYLYSQHNLQVSKFIFTYTIYKPAVPSIFAYTISKLSVRSILTKYTVFKSIFKNLQNIHQPTQMFATTMFR